MMILKDDRGFVTCNWDKPVFQLTQLNANPQVGKLVTETLKMSMKSSALSVGNPQKSNTQKQ